MDTPPSLEPDIGGFLRHVVDLDQAPSASCAEIELLALPFLETYIHSWALVTSDPLGILEISNFTNPCFICLFLELSSKVEAEPKLLLTLRWSTYVS
jgi:hypothetical protein